MTPRKVIVGVTGASGSIYARQVIESLVACPAIEEVAVIVSAYGGAVAAHEGVALPQADKLRYVAPNDMFDVVASGSARYDAMAVVPCSVGTLGRIASGVSEDLLGRAADVMLKERRRLVLCVRETPLNLIHIQNMERVTLAGGVILPAAPSFYSHPEDIEAVCRTVTERVLSLMGVEAEHYEWGK